MTRNANTLPRALQVVASEPSVTVLAVRGLVEAVEQAGVPSRDFLSTVRWDAARMDAIEVRVPLSEVFRLCDVALDLTHDKALGLHWAERLGNNTFAPLSHMLAHVESLRQGFQLLSEFQPLFCDQSFFALSENADTAIVRIPDWPSPSPRIHRFAAEVILAGIAKMFRFMFPHAKLSSASFDYGAPAHSAEYARVLETEVTFEQAFTSISMKRALLDAPLNHADDEVFRALRTVAQWRLERVSQRTPYTANVRELMLRQLPGRVSMVAAARSLGVSVRSLRRQLAAEGTSFRALQYSAFGSASKSLLRDSVRTIQQIAYELGFPDVTTFHRAFKRWTGTTPTKFRNASGVERRNI